MTESVFIKHIVFGRVPIEKTQRDIENYSFFLTNLYPNRAEITESSCQSNHSKWLLTYASNISLFKK